MRILGLNLPIPRLSFKNSVTTTLSNPSEWLVREILGRMNKAGVCVTPLSAMGISTVYACVNAISKSIATVPVCLHRRLPGGGSEPATDHYLYDFIQAEPNDEMTGSCFRRAVQANATLREAGYAMIIRNGLNEVVEIFPIMPLDIKVERPVINGPLIYWVQGKPIPKESILGIKGLTFDGVTGVSSLSMARDVIALAIALQDNASTFFGNGSRPGGTLEHPASLSQEAQDRLRTQIEDRLKGPDKAHAILILEEGLKYVAQREENGTSQFLESRIYQDKAIVRHYGVPPSKVGILDDAHFNNVEQENLAYVLDCIQPWAVTWQQELDRKLLTREERKTLFFRVDTSDLLVGDKKTRYESYGLGRQWGFLNVDEIRAKEGLNPLPDKQGQVYLRPVNMVDASAPAVLPPPDNDPTKQ